MPSIAFTMAGPPVGKQRPRVTKRGTYTPERTRCYERSLRSFACLATPRDWPIDRRYRLRVEFTGRCDGDNVAKSVADALEGVCWRNDRQVDEVTAVRLRDGHPRTIVTVELIELQSASQAHG